MNNPESVNLGVCGFLPILHVDMHRTSSRMRGQMHSLHAIPSDSDWLSSRSNQTRTLPSPLGMQLLSLLALGVFKLRPPDRYHFFAQIRQQKISTLTPALKN
ncbi:hypothetical protein TcWFU_006664 [Taenia crassiceps]|uniref:Uncharacterized protein n=1 Tax=Taenia crassiceps TaxID=6207 RepID=A0ABR4QM70_9CEST